MCIILIILKLFSGTSGVKENFFNVKIRLAGHEGYFDIAQLV